METILCSSQSVRRNLLAWLACLAVAVLLIALALVLSQAATVAAATPTRYVSPSGTDTNNNCLTSTGPCKTIGHALFVASGGDTIRAAVGTYAQNIIINKNITIKGASLSSTVIDGRAVTRVLDVNPGVTATLSELTIQNGKETGVPGGGLSNAGILTLKHVIVSNNTSSGGATANDNGGGIVNNGTLTIESSFVAKNHADNNGGGIYNQSGTLTVKSRVINSNTAGLYGGGIENQGTATMTYTTIGNNSAQDGADLDNPTLGTVTLSNVTINGNTATPGAGAGMIQSSKNPATLTNVTFRNNSAQGGGGGLLNTSNATATLTDVTFDSNFAANGGGIQNFGGTVTLTNVTYSDNGAGEGGGFSNVKGTATLINATFSGNSSQNCSCGAIFNFGTVNFKNTILANSLAGGNCYGPGGTFTDNGHNLDSGNTCGFSVANHDLINTDPLLGPLQNNGGYTDTLALDKGSPAINKGTNVGCPKTDQRGKIRVTLTDPTCDIGAYEYP